MQLLNQRFREMFRRASLAQHDRKKCVIPSETWESRGNEPLGLITAIAIIRKTSLIDLYANFFTFSRRFFSVFISVKKRG